MMFIVLSAAQADQARSVTLVPIALVDGTFIVNAAVLADPRHADVAALLSPLPRISLEEVTPLLAVDDGE